MKTKKAMNATEKKAWKREIRRQAKLHGVSIKKYLKLLKADE